MVICDKYLTTDRCLVIYLHLVWDFLSTTISTGIFTTCGKVRHEEHILAFLSLVKFSSLSLLFSKYGKLFVLRTKHLKITINLLYFVFTRKSRLVKGSF